MKSWFRISYLLATSLATLFLLVCDASGIFIYASYAPMIVLVVGVVLGGVLAAGKGGARTLGDLMVFGVATLMLVGVALACPFLPTSQRKAFFLDVQSIRPGMSLHEVQRRMAPYPKFEKYPHAITYLYRNNSSTADTAVVQLTSDGSRVDTVDYSPD